MSHILSNISRPLIVGTLACLVTPHLLGNGKFYGVSTPILFGFVAARASGIQEVTRDYVINMITRDPATSSVAQLVSPAITGSAMVALMAALDILDGHPLIYSALLEGFVIGGIAEIAGGFIQKTVIDPMAIQERLSNIASF